MGINFGGNGFGFAYAVWHRYTGIPIRRNIQTILLQYLCHLVGIFYVEIELRKRMWPQMQMLIDRGQRSDLVGFAELPVYLLKQAALV